VVRLPRGFTGLRALVVRKFFRWTVGWGGVKKKTRKEVKNPLFSGNELGWGKVSKKIYTSAVGGRR